jgi:hypothetical protein
MPSWAVSWGATAEERAASYPCDAVLPESDAALFRAVDVDAPTTVVWRWLCQLRAAPYSYDWIDNLGRRSPRRLIAGLERLRAGQTVMTIFELVSFAPEDHMTLLVSKPSAIRLFGRVAGTYRIATRPRGGCRLTVKLLARYPGGLYGVLLRWLLPWGDLIMMRKQLLTLKALAERDATPDRPAMRQG